MNWFGVIGAVVVASATVLVPGLLVTTALRLRGLAAMAVAGPLGYGCVGVAGVLFAALHLPFGWGAPLVTGLGAAAAALLVRALVARARPAVRLAPWDTWRPGAAIAPLAAALVAAVAIGVIAFAAVPEPDRISQTYDAMFHLNAAQSVVQSGDASSLHLYRLTHPTKDIAFYPAVWHSIVAITAETTGLPVPTATNAAWIGTAGPVWSLGCAFAAAVLLGGTGLRRGTTVPATQRTAIAAVAGLLASAFAAFPYLLLDFGTLYPNGLALTMLPVGLALAAAALPWPADGAWRPEQPAPRWRTAVLGAAWLGSAAFAHPRSVVSIVALGAPLAIAWFGARMAALARRGGRGPMLARIGWVALVVVAVGAAALALLFIYHYYDVADRPIADRLNGRPAVAREDFWQALLQGLLSTSLVSPSQDPLPIPLLLAGAVLAGAVAALARPGLRWTAATLGLVALLYACAAGSDADWAKIATGLWDKDKFRIIAMMPTIAVPLAAWVVVAGSAELAAVLRPPAQRRAEPRGRTVLVATTLAAAVVVGSAWTGPALAGIGSSIGGVFRLADSDKGGRLLDADQIALLQRVGRHVPADDVIIDDPWNGSALAWAIGGRETLFPHFGGYWGTTRKTVAGHLDDWRTDPAVCRAVRRLDLHWVVADRDRLAKFKKEKRAFRGIDRAVKAGDGLQRVDSQGGSSLYRLTACWGDA